MHHLFLGIKYEKRILLPNAVPSVNLPKLKVVKEAASSRKQRALKRKMADDSAEEERATACHGLGAEVDLEPSSKCMLQETLFKHEFDFNRSR